MESEMLDLPQPLGPTMAAMPSPWNFNSVRSQNDLNPRIWSFLSFSNVHSFNTTLRTARYGHCGRRGAFRLGETPLQISVPGDTRVARI